MNPLKLAAKHRLEKVMLHKNSEEDVLICYGRGALPSRIDRELLTKFNADDRKDLMTFYKSAENRSVSSSNGDNNVLYLRSLPLSIRRAAAAGVNDALCQKALQAHYHEVEDGYYLSSPYVNEIDEVALAGAFGKQDDGIQDIDRVRLSGLLTALPGLNLPDTFYATFYNDLQNYFFYRKHHEHVPGTMLIEAARQGYYAQFYSYTGARPGEVSISMDSLDAKFEEYTNPNYPVRMMVEDVDPQLPGNNRRQIFKRATFQQNGKVVGRVEMTGHVMRMREFKRMRNIGFNETHRFWPLKNISTSVLLDDGRGRQEYALHEISMKGFTVSLDKNRQLSEGQIFKYLFFVEGLGFVDGEAQLSHKREEQGKAVGDFAISTMTDESESKLREAIKNYTHAVPASGVF